ncbi:MAG: hypothetical protein M3P28_03650 [Thermoproteota archaeon]|nr:hypothetical protein [Thermoproteota archaeon]
MDIWFLEKLRNVKIKRYKPHNNPLNEHSAHSKHGGSLKWATQRKKREKRDGHRNGVHKYRSKRIDYEEKQDPDIQREIDRHGSDNVRIIQ